MSYKETNIFVLVVTNTFILAVYLISLLLMYRAGSLEEDNVFLLWGVVIAAMIILNILASILTSIVLAIVHAIKTGSDKAPRFLEDERDKFIELKGGRVSYIAYSLGVLVAMLTFVLDRPPLVMFSLIIFFSITAEIIGALAQLYYYRKGVQYG